MTSGRGADLTQPRCDESRDPTFSIVLAPEAFYQRQGGVRRTALDLGESISALAPGRVWEPDRLTRPDSSRHSLGRRLSASFDMHEHLRSLRRSHQPYIVHSLYYDLVIVRAGGIRVTTLYDMIHERCDVGSRRLRHAKRISCLNADHVVAISEASARDAQAIYGERMPPVTVIPCGISSSFFAPGRLQRNPKTPDPYILYVGSRSAYKNFDVLWNALRSDRRLDGFDLVLVGGEPCDDELIAGLAHRNRRTLHFQSVGDDDLIQLYDHASVLVVTSSYEGFGLTPIEGMARGCPVVSTRSAALAEYDGDLSFHFPAGSPTSCADAILSACEQRESLEDAMWRHVQQFRWDRIAELYYNLYCSLITGQKHDGNRGRLNG